MKHYLSNQQKSEIIEKITSFLEKYRKDLIATYIFGSFITEGYFSDIDIALLTRENPTSPLDFELMIEASIENIVKYPVDIRVINQAPLSFCQNVIKCGKVIMETDPDIRADFQGQMLKKYFDFARFHRQYLNEVRHAPV